MALFTDLPSELLYHILIFLDWRTLRDSACFVNREWAIVATAALGRDLSFRQPRSLLLWNAKCKHSVPRVDSILLSSSACSSSPDQFTELLRKCGARLSELRLVSCPSVLANGCGRKALPNLKTLYVGGGESIVPASIGATEAHWHQPSSASASSDDDRAVIRSAFIGAFLSLDLLTTFVAPASLRHLCISSEAFRNCATLSLFVDTLLPFIETLEIYITSPYFYHTDWSWMTAARSLAHAAVDIVLLSSFVSSVPTTLECLAVSFANPFESVSDPEHEVETVRRALRRYDSVQSLRVVEWRWRDDVEGQDFASLPPLVDLSAELERDGIQVVRGRSSPVWKSLEWWRPALRSSQQQL